MESRLNVLKNNSSLYGAGTHTCMRAHMHARVRACVGVCMYVYALFNDGIKTWLQSNLPRAVLLVKVSIEEEYILIYTPITIKTILNNV